MPAFIYYIIFFMLLGAMGMAVAGRNVPPRVRRHRWLKYGTYLLITGIMVSSFYWGFYKPLFIIIVTFSVVEWIKVTGRTKGPGVVQRLIATVLFILVITCFLLFGDNYPSGILLFIYFQVLLFDAFSQITGQLWGRRTLVPAISPTKTREGLAGGLICCLLFSAAASSWIDTTYDKGLLLGLITACSSFTGDLLASWYKRKTGVKDYSNWLPGQGGFLDRFDSFLFTGLVYYCGYLVIFNNGFDVRL